MDYTLTDLELLEGSRKIVFHEHFNALGQKGRQEGEKFAERYLIIILFSYSNFCSGIGYLYLYLAKKRRR